MANCLLTSGRKLPCKTSTGGLKNVYFVDFAKDNFTMSGKSLAVGESVVAFQYEIKGNSSLETTINSSRENGTTFYTSALNLTLTFLDQATQEQVKLLAAGRPQVVVEDYNGNFILVGNENGCDVNGGTIVTGAAMGDLSGFTLTFEAQEKEPPFFFDDTASFVESVSTVNIDPTGV